MTVQMIVKTSDYELKVVGKSNVIAAANGNTAYSNYGGCRSDLCKKRKMKGANRNLLIQ